MALQAILDHLDAIALLCAELQPPLTSADARELVSVCNRLSVLYDVVSKILATTKEHGDASSHLLKREDSYEEERKHDVQVDLEEPRSESRMHVDRDCKPSSEEHAPRENEDIEDDTAYEEPRDTSLDIDPKQATVALRVTHILTSLGADPPSPSEVAEVLFGDRIKRSVADLEDRALARLLRGLPHASLHVWAGVFGAFADSVVTTADIVFYSAAHDDIASITQRLEMRHKSLVTTDKGRAAHTAVSFVLLQIEAVKFATDWQARDALPGGKKWKGAFYRAAFTQDPAFAHEFEGLTEDARTQKVKQSTAQYAPWRNAVGHTVTARNRLRRLYNTFGPGVLLDPTWAADMLVRGRSRLFVPVLDAVSSHALQADPAVDALDPHALQALVDIMTVLGGDAIGAHVGRFVHACPPVKLANDSADVV